MRQPKGPVPQQMIPVFRELTSASALVFQNLPRFNHVQHRPIALRDADLREFDGEQIKILEGVIDGLGAMNATQVSDYSHTRLWKVVQDGELIPYEVAYISDEPVTGRDLKILDEVRAKHGW